MNNVTVKISKAKPNETANPASSTHAGIRKIIITMIVINAKVRKTVGLNRVLISIFDIFQNLRQFDS